MKTVISVATIIFLSSGPSWAFGGPSETCRAELRNQCSSQLEGLSFSRSDARQVREGMQECVESMSDRQCLEMVDSLKSADCPSRMTRRLTKKCKTL